MKRITFLFICLGAILLSSCSEQQQKPNIIYIMTDDHAVQAVSCLGSKINETPNLDRIAAEGMIFRNSFVTNSICAPSRAVLLTGKYNHINGKIDNHNIFDADQQTFPKLLQVAGYQTAMIGKWHLRSQPQGFDYWNILPGQGSYYNPEFIEMGEKKKYTGYVTDLITDFTIKWLENRDKEKPFCLLYHHKAPHRSWLPNTSHLTMYDGQEIYMPETFYDDYATRGSAAREQEMRIDSHMSDYWDLKLYGEVSDTIMGWNAQGWNRVYRRFTDEQRVAWDSAYQPKNKAFFEAGLTGNELLEWKYQRYIKDYLRCIASVDENVGRLLDYLEETGLDENTIVIYTSDQGFYLGEHGWFDKRFMYEESLRMPLLVKFPGIVKAGSENENIVLNLDFAPTILDIAGVPVPDDMQGVSLLPLLKGKGQDEWRKSMYYHYYEYPSVHMVKRHYGIRTERYKLIHFYYDIDEWELYDLQEDPNEMNNLYGQDGFEDITMELKEELEKLRAHYGDSDELTRSFLPPETKEE